MSRKFPKLLRLALLLGLGIAGLTLLWLQFGPPLRETRGPRGKVSGQAASVAPEGGNHELAAVPYSAAAELLATLRGLAAGGMCSEAVADVLRELRARFLALPASQALQALLEVLNLNLDAPTRLGFKIGPNGQLLAAPTFRVWMLDLIGEIDPAAAAAYSARIYAKGDSSDEWALALRNDWRGSVANGGIERVRGRTLEMLANDNWSRNPGIGFLQALDFAVATMAWEAVPRLEQWLAPASSDALRHGAWVALDRMTMEAPSDFLPLLASHKEWLGSQPMIRAGLMARCDLGDEVQRQAVESYLGRQDITAEEIGRFLEIVPNVSATVSYNLATTSRLVRPEQAARLDSAALAMASDWQRRSFPSRSQAEVARAVARLRESVSLAKQGGYLSQ